VLGCGAKVRSGARFVAQRTFGQRTFGRPAIVEQNVLLPGHENAINFVLAYEEPTLRESYGAEYETYRANVPRWLPRLTPWRAL